MKSAGIMGVKTAKWWFSTFLTPCTIFFRASIVPVFLLFALTSFEASQESSNTSDSGIPNYQVVAGGLTGQAIVPGFHWAMDEGQKRLGESLQDYSFPVFATLGVPMWHFLHTEGYHHVFSGAIPASFLRRLLFPFHSFL